MLPVLHRLKSEKDFASLARSRKSAYSKVLVIKVRENHLPYSRFGIVAGLKVHKRAVRRNVIKRRLREILNRHLGKLKPGWDVMLLASPASLEADFETLETQTLQTFRKIGLLNA